MAAPWASSGRISSASDVLAALQRVNTAAQQRATTSALAHAVQPGTTVAPADDITAVLPCHPDVQPLLPWPGGIRRGVTVTVSGSTSLLMTLMGMMMTGTSAWAAIVGMPQYGLLSAIQDYGLPSDRVALVPEPGPDWPTIVSTLIDGVDVVVVQPPADVPAALARALSSRARQKGAVLIPTRAWPGAELALEAGAQRWHGLGQGRGRLKYCDLEVRSNGRGKAVRPKTATLTLPPGTRKPPIVFPPPAHAPAAVQQPDNPLWEHVEPSPPPADPWATLRP